MSAEDLARALHNAVAGAIGEARSKGETTLPRQAWTHIKGKVAHDFPRDFQQAIDVSIEYNNGVFDENALDEHLDRLIDGHKDRVESKTMDKE